MIILFIVSISLRVYTPLIYGWAVQQVLGESLIVCDMETFHLALSAYYNSLDISQ